MEIRDKLLLGLYGLRELRAKQDLEIESLMLNGKAVDEIQSEFEDRSAINELIDTLAGILDWPIISVTEEVLLKGGKENGTT